MARTPSTMLDLGTLAADFSLPEVTSGKAISLAAFPTTQPLLVIFLCHHCPYVKHVKSELSALGKAYQGHISIVGISANDVGVSPDDSPEGLARMAEDWGLAYPVLYDESQEVAKAYRAACTPDLFLFDAARKLVYRGQLDGSRPGNEVPVTGSDLRAAIDAVLRGAPVSSQQVPSLGCNIKWKPGNEPSYYPAA